MPSSAATAVLAPPPQTLADALIARRVWTDALLVVGASLLVAASARVEISLLPFTPVPITGQTLGVLLSGMLLGSRRGALALALYLLEGAMGLPFFSGGGAGIAHLTGPTAGYLYSYPFVAFLLGWLAERGWDRTPLRTAAAMLLGGAFILGMGTLFLAPFVGGIGPAFLKGWLPFIPGDIVKTALAAALLPGGWKLLGGGTGSGQAPTRR